MDGLGYSEGFVFRVLIPLFFLASVAFGGPLTAVSSNLSGDSLWTWNGTAWVYKALSGGSTPTGTGWVHVTGGVQDGAASTPSKADVGLGSADNTSDANKPVSTATQTALDLKAPVSNAAFTGTFAAPNGTLTLAMLANMATASILGRATAGTGAPEVLSAATTKSLLSLNLVENTALSTWAGTANITTLGTITTGVWTGTDVAVADGGTGRSTGTTAYGLIAAGTTATGAQQTLAAGATTEILVGGGASALPAWTTATGTGAPVRQGTPTLTTPVIGAATGTSVALTGDMATSGGGIGFTAGNGGAVTQATNKSTGVTLNERMGNITMNGAALAAATIVSFTWTNSTVSAEDLVICRHHATGTFAAYTINSRAAAGSSVISIRNNTAGSLSEAIILKCMVFDGVNN